MEAVILPIIAILINITLIILFFSKKHVINKETKLYSIMLILNVVFVLIGLLTFAVAKITNNLYFVGILQKLYMLLLMILNYFSLKYCFTIARPTIKNIKFIKISILIITFISMILLLILPLNVIFEGNLLDGNGLSYNVAVIYSLFTFLLIVILTIYLEFKNKNTIFKIVPFLILYVVAFILRTYYKELIFEGFFYAYILFIMYNTIENPDIKMVRQLEIANIEVEKASRAKSEFLSSMSHEIRTPLNAIVGFSSLIKEADTLEEAKENAKDIVSSSEKLLTMISNVLDIARIDTNKSKLKNVNYNFNQELNNVIYLFISKAEEKGILLQDEIDDLPKTLNGDIESIKRIVANLLDNAIKYTEKGSIHLIVKKKIEKDNCKITITVSDTGVGMSKKVLNNIFEEFNREEKYKDTSTSGMGLGLSISKKLLDMMGGKIECESNIGKGTTFTVYLTQKIVEE